MSKTYRLNPETFEEAIERNYLKRKKKEDQERRKFYDNMPHDHDDCDEVIDERNS